ncbi:hypothetical protein JD78_01762 [Modestobacter roseus]|uniref:Uncharacterized protein n=1 Tax=Modestobacter roseus TaxID=1181884 RepID=A0A562IQC1_9ACTN|nr:DUF6518 family protein [Modestobacter roseus]TWH73239.1 hypothetical protein JD78_01762 [Modestobacter roseus]
MTTVLPPPAPPLPSWPAPSARTELARWWLPVLVLVLGAGGGVLTERVQGALAGSWAHWGHAVAAWCLASFAVGALARRWRGAVAAAVATQLLLVVGFHAARAVQLLPVDEAAAVVWSVAGVAAGLVFGTVGWWWRAARQRLAALVLLAVVVPVVWADTAVVDAVTVTC